MANAAMDSPPLQSSTPTAAVVEMPPLHLEAAVEDVAADNCATPLHHNDDDATVHVSRATAKPRSQRVLRA